MAMLKNAVNLSKIIFFHNDKCSCTSSICVEHVCKVLKRNTESPRRSRFHKPLLYISNGQEMTMLKNNVNLSKIIFSAL